MDAIFNVGDKIKCFKNYSHGRIKKGEIWTLAKPEPGGWLISSDISFSISISEGDILAHFNKLTERQLKLLAKKLEQQSWKILETNGPVTNKEKTKDITSDLYNIDRKKSRNYNAKGNFGTPKYQSYDGPTYSDDEASNILIDIFSPVKPQIDDSHNYVFLCKIKDIIEHPKVFEHDHIFIPKNEIHIDSEDVYVTKKFFGHNI